MFQSIFHSSIAGGRRDPFKSALERTPDDYIEECPACKGLKQCIWQKHMPDLLKKTLLTEFKEIVDGEATFNAAKKRYAAYRYINKVIDGHGHGKRRGLPNCVVAGIRGFMYGDGIRAGYQNNPNDAENDLTVEFENEAIADITVSYSED